MDATSRALVKLDIVEVLDILYRRADHGARAKPTVAELNEIIRRLERAKATVANG